MYTLTATIDRFEKGKAVVRLEDGQELHLAKRLLPAKISEGSVLNLELFRAEDSEKRRENIARYLLEEILHPNELPKD